MRYNETTMTRSRQTMPVSEFLEMNGTVKQQAEGENPIDWLASQFLPDADRDEGYQDWIVRQVVQILETALLSDTVRDGRHVARKVSGVEMSTEDKNWLFKALGHHPEVLAVWRSLLAVAIAGRGIYSEWGWSMSSALAPAIESLCGSVPGYSIMPMSGTCLVKQSPFGGAGTQLFYGKPAGLNQLQP